MESKTKMNSTYRNILIVLGLIAFFVYVIHFVQHRPAATEIKVGSTTIYAQMADTEHERSMGLSFTQKLNDNAGMLFVFDEVGPKNFWMRDMLFDLDIIWLDENKQVVGFFEKVSKNSYNQQHPELSKIFHSPDNTKYVLEVNSGTIEKIKIKTGDFLKFDY
jgi:uncharacterized membrane protein (UPF0127 family)